MREEERGRESDEEKKKDEGGEIRVWVGGVRGEGMAAAAESANKK